MEQLDEERMAQVLGGTCRDWRDCPMEMNPPSALPRSSLPPWTGEQLMRRTLRDLPSVLAV